VTTQRNIASPPWLAAWIWSSVFLSGAAVFISRGVDPRLVHQASSRTFYGTEAYLGEFLGHPGGPIEYLERLFLHYCAHPLFGVLAYAVVLALLVIGSARLCYAIRGTPPRALALLPAGLLLLLANQYSYPWFKTGLGSILAVAGMALVSGSVRGPVRRVLATLVLAPAVYWLGGIAPCQALVLGLGLIELSCHRQFRIGLIMVVLAAIIGCVAGFPYRKLPERLLALWGNYPNVIFTLATYASAPAMAIGLSLMPKPKPDIQPSGKRRPVSARPLSFTENFLRLTGKPIVRIAVPLLLFAAGTAWISRSFDYAFRSLLLVEHNINNQDWRRVLAARASLPAANFFLRLCTLRSLYELHNLPEDQFAYMASAEEDLMPIHQAGIRSYNLYADTLLELGQPNLAEHWANEALENEGETPANLWLLARINLAKGRTRAARIFLNRLCSIPGFSAQANRYLISLENDSGGTSLTEIARVRQFAVKTDTPSGVTDTESMLLQCLDSNRHNQMAFEFLMAHYLFTLQLDRAARFMKNLPDFSYNHIPRHYEEALILYRSLQPNAPVDLKALQVRSETVQRYRQFADRLSQYKGNLTAAFHALRAEFGDTYWFYYHFRETMGRPS
jgi:hypothetical protein